MHQTCSNLFCSDFPHFSSTGINNRQIFSNNKWSRQKLSVSTTSKKCTFAKYLFHWYNNINRLIGIFPEKCAKTLFQQKIDTWWLFTDDNYDKNTAILRQLLCASPLNTINEQRGSINRKLAEALESENKKTWFICDFCL